MLQSHATAIPSPLPVPSKAPTYVPGICTIQLFEKMVSLPDVSHPVGEYEFTVSVRDNVDNIIYSGWPDINNFNEPIAILTSQSPLPYNVTIDFEDSDLQGWDTHISNSWPEWGIALTAGPTQWTSLITKADAGNGPWCSLSAWDNTIGVNSVSISVLV